MQNFSIYDDIALRTDGAMFLGVVGSVRSGKSTFISRVMELLVLPNIPEGQDKVRMIDELPQSGSGATIMTTQPKFVPAQPVELPLGQNGNVQVRLVDCVGYMIPGALGGNENEKPRYVKTPWSETELPFDKAAELGTQKVICDHSTIGILITTDGSITDIPRASYCDAEERVARELKELNKPFVIVLNSRHPQEEATQALRAQLQEKYSVPVLCTDVKNMSVADVENIMEAVLYEFPVTQLDFTLPTWVASLADDHWLTEKILTAVRESVQSVSRMSDHKNLGAGELWQELGAAPTLRSVDLATGKVLYDLRLDQSLFYQILGENCGVEIRGDRHLMELMRELVHAKSEYDKVADALESVRTTGYGLVAPSQQELVLDEPELVKQGNRFGVRLKASGPSLHMIKVDIESVITPIIGAEQDSQQLLDYIMERFKGDPQLLWETEMFGKSLNVLIKEGLSTKLMGMPIDARDKLAQTMSKMINHGNGGMICILL